MWPCSTASCGTSSSARASRCARCLCSCRHRPLRGDSKTSESAATSPLPWLNCCTPPPWSTTMWSMKVPCAAASFRFRPCGRKKSRCSWEIICSRAACSWRWTEKPMTCWKSPPKPFASWAKGNFCKSKKPAGWTSPRRYTSTSSNAKRPPWLPHVVRVERRPCGPWTKGMRKMWSGCGSLVSWWGWPFKSRMTCSIWAKASALASRPGATSANARWPCPSSTPCKWPRLRNGGVLSGWSNTATTTTPQSKKSWTPSSKARAWNTLGARCASWRKKRSDCWMPTRNRRPKRPWSTSSNSPWNASDDGTLAPASAAALSSLFSPWGTHPHGALARWKCQARGHRCSRRHHRNRRVRRGRSVIQVLPVVGRPETRQMGGVLSGRQAVVCAPISPRGPSGGLFYVASQRKALHHRAIRLHWQPHRHVAFLRWPRGVDPGRKRALHSQLNVNSSTVGGACTAWPGANFAGRNLPCLHRSHFRGPKCSPPSSFGCWHGWRWACASSHTRSHKRQAPRSSTSPNGAMKPFTKWRCMAFQQALPSLKESSKAEADKANWRPNPTITSASSATATGTENACTTTMTAEANAFDRTTTRPRVSTTTASSWSGTATRHCSSSSPRTTYAGPKGWRNAGTPPTPNTPTYSSTSSNGTTLISTTSKALRCRPTGRRLRRPKQPKRPPETKCSKRSRTRTWIRPGPPAPLAVAAYRPARITSGTSWPNQETPTMPLRSNWISWAGNCTATTTSTARTARTHRALARSSTCNPSATGAEHCGWKCAPKKPFGKPPNAAASASNPSFAKTAWPRSHQGRQTESCRSNGASQKKANCRTGSVRFAAPTAKLSQAVLKRSQAA